MHAQSRPPRVPERRDGEMELPSAGRRPATSFPVEVTDVSREGAGIRVSPRDRHHVLRGQSIKLRFSAGIRPVEIPGQIVWAIPRADGGGVHCGLRLHLALAGSMNRRAFQDWVASLLRSSRQTK